MHMLKMCTYNNWSIRLFHFGKKNVVQIISLIWESNSVYAWKHGLDDVPQRNIGRVTISADHFVDVLMWAADIWKCALIYC